MTDYFGLEGLTPLEVRKISITVMFEGQEVEYSAGTIAEKAVLPGTLRRLFDRIKYKTGLYPAMGKTLLELCKIEH